MENKNKDKIIIGLIIALAIAIGNNFIKEKQGDSLNENFTLLDKNEDDLLLEDETDDDAKENEAMKVHITGQINREGVYEIKDGDRLEDLINKAGGLSPDADSKSLNLAMKLEDQMKIYIPSKDEILDQEDASTDQIISNADPSLSLIHI